MKGLTSIELAILLAIIIVIAVAVGWYMYTTFLASTSSSPKLQIVSAVYNSTKHTLNLTVVNPGPVSKVGIAAIYLNGQPCSSPTYPPYTVTITIASSQTSTTSVTTTTAIPMSNQTITISTTCSGISAAVGTQLSGQLVTTAGTTFPFIVTVVS